MTAITQSTSEAAPLRVGRFPSIDQVRGAVMVLMALDHARWFFTNISAYQPETLAQTNFWLFLTRWVTHYCAPGFFLIAGFGIFLFGAKTGDKKALRAYLLSRGAMLVALELTVVGYSWVFTPGYSFGGVIWSLGWSFILMAALVAIPPRVLLGVSASVLVFHNLLDGVAAPASGWSLFAWRWLYEPGVTSIPGIVDRYYVLFPVVPWLAIMVLGYALGSWYRRDGAQRRRAFVTIGWGMLAAFTLLRLTNLYGNPPALFLSAATAGDFALQDTLSKALISFLNVEKYPPSLQFTLMTLGPIFLWLGYTRLDNRETRARLFSRVMVVFGRVPLFYYVLHLYLIHLMALVVVGAAGQPVGWIAFGADPSASRPEGYGFDLPVVWLMWFVAVTILYFACRWYEGYKRTHTHAWLKFL